MLVSFLISCQAPPAARQKLTYPDIQGFFKQEIKRLQKVQPLIEKSVHLNKENETKTLSEINWEDELSLFIQSDINKPAFKGLYQKQKEADEVVYSTSDPKLKTRQIRILYSPKGKIERIAITNHTQNSLYTSDEFLEYRPDSLYQIVKRQEVRLMGTQNYWVLGKFKIKSAY